MSGQQSQRGYGSSYSGQPNVPLPMTNQQPQREYGTHASGRSIVPLEMANQQPQRGYGSHASGRSIVPLEMANQQPQSGYGSPYYRQPTVSNPSQGQYDNEHARACSYVQEQLRAQIGDQQPAWDGPVPGFWDRVDQATNQTRSGNQPTQRATTAFGQGQPMNETPRASQQGGGYRANSGGPAMGMQQMSANYGQQHTTGPTQSVNAGHRHPATYNQGGNQQGYTHSQSGAPVYHSRTNRSGNGMNGHNSHQNGGANSY